MGLTEQIHSPGGKEASLSQAAGTYIGPAVSSCHLVVGVHRKYYRVSEKTQKSGKTQRNQCLS